MGWGEGSREPRPVERGSALAARAIIRAPAGLDDTPDRATVAATGFALAAIDEELVLEIPLAPLTIDVV